MLVQSRSDCIILSTSPRICAAAVGAQYAIVAGGVATSARVVLGSLCDKEATFVKPLVNR